MVSEIKIELKKSDCGSSRRSVRVKNRTVFKNGGGG